MYFFTPLKLKPCIKAILWKFRNTSKTLSAHSNVTCYEVGGWMFDPLSPASPTLPHFSPPFSPSISLPIPLSIHLVLFSSLPFTYTYIRASGEWEVKKLEVWVGWVWRVGGWGNREGLPLTVARRPPGWVGRAHSRVGQKKILWSQSGWLSGYLGACSSVTGETFMLSTGLIVFFVPFEKRENLALWLHVNAAHRTSDWTLILFVCPLDRFRGFVFQSV